jgi:PAS domain S-box-containing protein
MAARMDEMLQFVAAAGRTLGASLSCSDLMKLAADLCIPQLADVAVLGISDPACAAQIADQCLIVRHRLREREAGVEAVLRGSLPLLGQVGGQLFRQPVTSRGIWLPAVSASALHRITGQAGGDLARMAADMDIASLIVVPLESDQVWIGVLALGRMDGARYAAAEFAAARSLGARIASALDSSRLRESLVVEDARRIRAEDALLKWTHAFEHAPYGAAIVDPSGRLESVNLAFARMHGYTTTSELRGLRFSQLREAGPERLPQEGGSGTGAVWESVQQRRDGTTFPALLSDTPLRTPEGHLLYRAVTVQDLTPLRRTEEQLRHAQRMEALGRLAGGVAHEVNNMMTVVLGFADLLSKAPELNEEHRDDVRHVIEAADRASAISRQLLAYGRQQILRPEPVDLNHLIQRVVGLLRPLLAAVVTVQVDLGDNEADGVYADPGQLEQVLINLALNARDAMPDGGTLRLTTRFQEVPPEVATYHLGFELPPGRHALLTVADSGVGMDAETLAQAFDPFFTTKPIGKGTGLGLATVYGIVKQSGGYVWAESDPGRGTTFTICLPAVRLGYAARADQTDVSPNGNDARVLVVDDEPGVRQLSVRMLDRLGYQAVEVADGVEALAAIGASPPDVVLTDLMMPGMNGRELRDRIRTLYPGLPVVLMSGHPAAETLRGELAGPADYWIDKPFTLAGLAAGLQEALGARVPGG